MKLAVEFKFEDQICELRVAKGTVGWSVRLSQGDSNWTQNYREVHSYWSVVSLALPSVLNQFPPVFLSAGEVLCYLYSVGATGITMSEVFSDGMVVNSTVQQLWEFV